MSEFTRFESSLVTESANSDDEQNEIAAVLERIGERKRIEREEARMEETQGRQSLAIPAHSGVSFFLALSSQVKEWSF